jgi:hypothetical protein
MTAITLNDYQALIVASRAIRGALGGSDGGWAADIKKLLYGRSTGDKHRDAVIVRHAHNIAHSILNGGIRSMYPGLPPHRVGLPYAEAVEAA